MTREKTPDYAKENRKAWQGFAAEYVEPAQRSWGAAEPKWGIWGIPESDVEMLPETLEGQRCIELGCGTAYVSAWMARRGAMSAGSIRLRISSPPQAPCKVDTVSHFR